MYCIRVSSGVVRFSKQYVELWVLKSTPQEKIFTSVRAAALRLGPDLALCFVFQWVPNVPLRVGFSDRRSCGLPSPHRAHGCKLGRAPGLAAPRKHAARVS